MCYFELWERPNFFSKSLRRFATISRSSGEIGSALPDAIRSARTLTRLGVSAIIFTFCSVCRNVVATRKPRSVLDCNLSMPATRLSQGREPSDCSQLLAFSSTLLLRLGLVVKHSEELPHGLYAPARTFLRLPKKPLAVQLLQHSYNFPQLSQVEKHATRGNHHCFILGHVQQRGIEPQMIYLPN